MEKQNNDVSKSIDLNKIMAAEYIRSNKSIPDDLVNAAVGLLKIKDLHSFVPDVIKKRVECKTLEDLLALYPYQYVYTGSSIKLKNKFTPIVYDIWQTYYITPNEWKYDLFLTYKLNQSDLLEIDEILNKIMEEHYNNDYQIFTRFLQICTIKYKDSILNSKTIDIINEWIEIKKTTMVDYLNGDVKSYKTPAIKWSGDKVDFIKLIYSLFYAKLINDGIGEVTNIANDLAIIFKVEYNNKSNDLTKHLSAASNTNRNIFELHKILIEAFEKFLKEKHSKKKFRKLT